MLDLKKLISSKARLFIQLSIQIQIHSIVKPIILATRMNSTISMNTKQRRFIVTGRCPSNNKAQPINQVQAIIIITMIPLIRIDRPGTGRIVNNIPTQPPKHIISQIRIIQRSITLDQSKDSLTILKIVQLAKLKPITNRRIKCMKSSSSR